MAGSVQVSFNDKSYNKKITNSLETDEALGKVVGVERWILGD